MVNIGALRPMNERRFVVVYLPFTPYFFNHAYGPGEHEKYVDIRHVYKSRLQKSNHKLNFVSVKHSNATEIYFNTEEQDKCTQCKRKDIMNISPGIHLTQEYINKILKK